MDEKQINEYIEKGYIHFNSIIEVLGKPKKHIEDTIRNYVKKIKQDKNIKLINEKYSDTEEVENLFSVFVEIEALAKNTSELIFFCFDYMPSSIEIMAPEELKYQKNNLSSFLNDLQARLHTIDMALKQYKSRNEMLIKNSATLLRNIIIAILEKGPRTIDEISKRVGLKKDKIENILNIMLNEKRIKKKGKNYELK